MPQSSHGSASAGEDLRRLLAEHEQLLGENLEYMGVLSRYARALGLCSTLGLEALAERIIEGLCLETRTQGGVLWVAQDERGGMLHLATARGLVKADDAQATLRAEDPPPGLEALQETGCGAFVARLTPGRAGEVGGEALFLRLRHAGRLLAVARVSDRLDAPAFDARDFSSAEQFGEMAAVALANALRFRAVERNALRDPRTHAYTPAFFDGVVATECEKAHRFGRHFSLLDVELAGLDAWRARLGEGAATALVDGFALRLQQVLRGTDVCAVDGESRYRLLLAETDALGAASLKRRLRRLLESILPAATEGLDAPALRVAAATFPADGPRLEDLLRRLARRLEEESVSLARVLERESHGFAESHALLLQHASPPPAELPEQALRFVLEEVARRAHERGMLWLLPGADLQTAALDELSRLRGRECRVEIVLVGTDSPQALAGVPVTVVPPRPEAVEGAHPGAPAAPFLVYLGDGPAYAWLREQAAGGARFLHTSDRALVEHLAFQLQQELGGGLAA